VLTEVKFRFSPLATHPVPFRSFKAGCGYWLMVNRNSQFSNSKFQFSNNKHTVIGHWSLVIRELSIYIHHSFRR
jgi:hypothetical protein